MRKSSARVSKSDPKGTKSEPKGTKSEPKGSRREPKGRQKGAKSEPNPPTLVSGVLEHLKQRGEFTSPLPPSALGDFFATPVPFGLNSPKL